MNKEIKSCPFCGSKDLRFPVHSTPWLHCCVCHADGPVSNSLEGALDGWNKRSNEQVDNTKWQAVAEKLAEYLAAICDMFPASECENCPLYDCAGCLGDIKNYVIKKAKKELGYE